MKKAFTLAEVLITMGIIGVVSAITVPALNQSWQRDAYVTQLRKVYSEVAQAAVRCKTDNNVQSLTEARLDGNIANGFMKKYFVITKDCGTSYDGCFASSYKTVNGNTADSTAGHTCGFVGIIASGAAICADYDVNDATGQVITFEIDVNGPKDPNIVGRDVFVMAVDKNGKVFDQSGNAFHEDATNFYAGALGQIMNDGWKMNY